MDKIGSQTDRQRLLDRAVSLLVASGRRGVVAVVGDSMKPTLEDGQSVEVDFAEFRPRRGDLLLYRRETVQGVRREVHRYLGRSRARDGRSALRTRGDGNPYLDAPVDRGAVEGRVLTARVGGSWRTFRGRRPRLWAWLLAWHDLSWSLLWAGTRGAGRLLGPIGRRIAPERWIAGFERRLLGLGHRLLFRHFHPIVEAPSRAGQGRPELENHD